MNKKLKVKVKQYKKILIFKESMINLFKFYKEFKILKVSILIKLLMNL